MFSCVIIDDDRHAADTLEKYIGSYPSLKLVRSYTDPQDALSAMVKAEPVDLVFMDIDMPKINGIELARELRHKTSKLVFTTSHVKYGYEAFKIRADDYLLKPFTQGEFIISMNNIFSEQTREKKPEFFFVRNKEDNHKMVNIKYKDVIAIESKLNYVLIHTTTKQVLTYMSLHEISKQFKPYAEFVQFHRSFIIAYAHIEHFDARRIKMDNGLELTVGEFYRKSFSEFVSKHLLKAERKS